MKSDILNSIKHRSEILQMNSDAIAESILEMANIVISCLENSNTIFFCGNGGSAAESQHMAAEYCATLDHKRPRIGMSAIALTTDTSFITAWGNDFGYDGIFKRQFETLSSPGDLLFAYSTSGNSTNVSLAAEFAIKNDRKVISLTGNHNQMKLEEFSTYLFKAPSKSTPNIQEIHTIVGHEICTLVEKKLFNF